MSKATDGNGRAYSKEATIVPEGAVGATGTLSMRRCKEGGYMLRGTFSGSPFEPTYMYDFRHLRVSILIGACTLSKRTRLVITSG